jgi:hypothetical protein
MEHEQATKFLKRFNNAKIQAQSAGNIYTDDQAVHLFISAMEPSTMSKYALAANIVLDRRICSFLILRLAFSNWMKKPLESTKPAFMPTCTVT